MAEAIARGGDSGSIAAAQQSLVDGDDLIAGLQYKDAVAAYKDAVSQAESA